MEAIHKTKAEKSREKTLPAQFAARRSHNKIARSRKIAAREERILTGAAADLK